MVDGFGGREFVATLMDDLVEAGVNGDIMTMGINCLSPARGA